MVWIVVDATAATDDDLIGGAIGKPETWSPQIVVWTRELETGRWRKCGAACSVGCGIKAVKSAFKIRA